VVRSGQHIANRKPMVSPAATYDGTTARVFLNGALDGSQSLGGPSSSSLPLVVGRSEIAAKSFHGYIQGVRVSNQAAASFPYGACGLITAEPSSAAGAEITPPTPGSANLALTGLSTYPSTSGGVVVRAIVENQGDAPTQNGFYTDLYVDHLPVGPGDYTGSVQFWVNDPIAAGATVALTTVLSDVLSVRGLSTAPLQPPNETTVTLYTQADSVGVLDEPDGADNISDGVEVCIASADTYEDDGSPAQARLIAQGETQYHNFDSLGDQDWLKFTVQSGERYSIQTSNLGLVADTYLFLYDIDGSTLLAANDDHGGSLASRIEWTAPSSGSYYVLVKHWNPNVGGCGTAYDIAVKIGGGGWSIYLPLVTRH
jgi:hypothetical protein